MLQMLSSIPSPADGNIGFVHIYGLLIAIGVVVSTTFADRRWRRRGGDKDTIGDLAFILVIFGAIGARLYHVATDYEMYFPDNMGQIINVTKGGLSIWGAVLGGLLALIVVAKRRKLPTLMLADCLAPAILIAQAIGRWGNYANQELFGKPLDAPWALEILPQHRPPAYLEYSTFHPTFLYESLWCLAMFFVITFLERRRHWKVGQATFAYVALYTLGRFAFENMRIDFARKIGPLRFNAWVSVVLFIVGVVGFLYYGRNGKEWPVTPDGTPDGKPGPLLASQTSSASDSTTTSPTEDVNEYEATRVATEGLEQ